MKITLIQTMATNLTKNYEDIGGVFGYNGILCTRPSFSWEFVDKNY